MPVIAERDREILLQRFEQSLERDVTIKFFGESHARSVLTIPGLPTNPMAQIAGDLARELADLSPKIKLEVYDFHGDGAEAARELEITRVPAYVLGDDPEGRIRFYGTPVGNEFATMIETVEALSQDAPRLAPTVVKMAQSLIQQPVQLQVFVTPT
jgi:alkyl hydroperoxide reductase subunit AhpF